MKFFDIGVRLSNRSWQFWHPESGFIGGALLSVIGFGLSYISFWFIPVALIYAIAAALVYSYYS